MKKIALLIVMVSMLVACNWGKDSKETKEEKQESPAPTFTQEQEAEIRRMAQETVNASIQPVSEDMVANFDSVFKLLNNAPAAKADPSKEKDAPVADTTKKGGGKPASNYMSKKQVDALLAKTQKNNRKEFDEVLRRLAAVESDVRDMKPKVEGLVQWYNTIEHPTQPPPKPNDYKQ